MGTNVSGGVTVNLLTNGDSLNTSLISTAALYQTFKKGTDEFSPNWATIADAQRPLIVPRVYSTMEAQELNVTGITWKYNGVNMEFNAGGTCTAPDVAANKVMRTTHNGKEALKMIGNVASGTNNDSDTIAFSGIVEASGQTVAVSAETTLLIEEASAGLYRLFLLTDDDVIDGDETSVILTAELYNMGAKVNSGVQYEFLDSSGVVLRTKGSSPTFNITRAMIDSELMVVCRAYIGSAIVAQEQRQVWDSTDPYTIICKQGTNVRQYGTENTTYSFSLMNTRLGAVVPSVIFTIKVYKNSNSSDITSQFTKTNTSVTITGAKITEHKSLYIDVSCTV